MLQGSDTCRIQMGLQQPYLFSCWVRVFLHTALEKITHGGAVPLGSSRSYLFCPGKCRHPSAHDQRQQLGPALHLCLLIWVTRAWLRAGVTLEQQRSTSLRFLTHVFHCWMAFNKADLNSHKIQIFPCDTSLFPLIIGAC